MLTIFINYYIFLLLVLLLFYLIGNGLLYLLKIKILYSSTDTFTKLFSGMIVFVIITSLYYTKFKTLQCGFFIIALFFLIDYFKNKREYITACDSERPSYPRLFAEVGIISLLIFALRFYFIYNSSGIPIVSHIDYTIYAHLSNFLVKTGQENASLNFIYANEMGVSPYHFFDLWLNVGLCFFNVNPLLCLVLVSYSSATVILWFGLVALFSFFKKINIYHKTACFFFLFLSGIWFGFFSEADFLKSSELFSANIFNYCKLFPIYIFLLSALLLFLNNKYKLAVLSLLCLPVANITTSIGILCSVLSFPIFHYFIFAKNKSNKKDANDFYVYITAAAILLVIYIWLFYKTFGENTPTVVPTSLKDLIPAIIDSSNLRTIINIIGKTTIQLFLVYFPAIMITIFLLTRFKIKIFIENNIFILFVPLIVIFSLLGWAFMNPLPGFAVTIFIYISVSMFNLISIAACIFFLFIKNPNNKGVFYIGTFVIFSTLLQSIFYTYTHEVFRQTRSIIFLKEINKIAPDLSSHGAFMLDKEYYRNTDFGYIPVMTTIGNYLAYTESRTFPISISVNDYPFSKEKRQLALEEQSLKGSPFYQYVEKQKASEKFKNINLSRLDFIHEYKINYLITTKDVILDSLLEHEIKREIRDEKTGERFFLLK